MSETPRIHPGANDTAVMVLEIAIAVGTAILAVLQARNAGGVQR